jgi:methylenetetrahydrofolate reductase (NADPH)
MKVVDHISAAKDTLVSFEILPPLKGKTINSLWNHLDPLMEFKPSFINVTYHRSESMFKKRSDSTFEKVEIRKRPGTVGICAALMNHYKIDAVPHIICGGFSKQETEDALIDLNFLGIDNALVLRGDAAKNEASFEPEPGGHKYSIDLEEDIKNGSRSQFCIGVSGYPEKHFEAPNLDSDLMHLKNKIDAGGEYIMTQMFFDNQKFFDYQKSCHNLGVQVPIIPGLKPITSKKQLTVLPRIFHTDIPMELSSEILKCKTDEEVEQVGIEWLIMQSKALKKFGVPVLHYYTLGKPDVIRQVVSKVF